MFIISPLPLIFASLLLNHIAHAKSVGLHHSKGQLFSSIVESELPAGTPQSPITIHDDGDGLFTVTSAVASRTVMMTDEESVLTLVRLDNVHPTFLTLLFNTVSGSFKQSVRAEITFAKDGNSATFSYVFNNFQSICQPSGLAHTEFDCSPSHHLAESIGPIRLPKPSSLPDWAQSGIMSASFKVSASPTSGTADVLIIETSFYALVLE